MAAAGTLVFNRGDAAYNYAGNIANNGTVVSISSGTMTISGSVTGGVLANNSPGDLELTGISPLGPRFFD